MDRPSQALEGRYQQNLGQQADVKTSLMNEMSLAIQRIVSCTDTARACAENLEGPRPAEVANPQPPVQPNIQALTRDLHSCITELEQQLGRVRKFIS